MAYRYVCVLLIISYNKDQHLILILTSISRYHLPQSAKDGRRKCLVKIASTGVTEEGGGSL